MRKLLAVVVLSLAVGSVGCAYGGMAVTSDGTMYVARNDGLLFGLLRKMYACKPSGQTLTCEEVTGAP